MMGYFLVTDIGDIGGLLFTQPFPLSCFSRHFGFRLQLPEAYQGSLLQQVPRNCSMFSCQSKLKCGTTKSASTRPTRGGYCRSFTLQPRMRSGWSSLESSKRPKLVTSTWVSQPLWGIGLAISLLEHCATLPATSCKLWSCWLCQKPATLRWNVTSVVQRLLGTIPVAHHTAVLQWVQSTC